MDTNSESPSGIDLHPEPEKAMRISRRTSMAILAVIVLLLLAFAYGGYRRTLRNRAAARDASLPKAAMPATQAGAEFLQSIPVNTGPTVLRVSGRSASPQAAVPRSGLTHERVVLRHPNAPRILQIAPPPIHEETLEDRRISAAYQEEQQALEAPTAIRNSVAGSLSAAASQPAINNLSQAEALSRVLDSRQSGTSVPLPTGQAVENDYDRENMQSRKEAFLASARKYQPDDYLRATRESPLSRYEIKAGWEIPAVLEQSLNSDLPGELKALVSSNVYDTATGLYLLIPQGSRLIGKYDSRISYGQDGVQVAWDRIIFPDASSIYLDGMLGLDSHGNAGLRDKIDRHYRRLIGFSVLTSLFTAAFDISQRTSQSALVYPSPTQTAGTAVGQELSQTGAQITRRNLNVQPTIKVPAGYRFTVRVNRDILFEAPYAQPSTESGSQRGSR